MSTISASTATNTAYKVTADTTGTLVLQTGATPTTAVIIGSDQSVSIAGSVSAPSVTFSNFGSATTAVVGLGDGNTGLFRPAAQTLGFTANGSERARIDSSGSFMVGQTAVGNANNNGFWVYPTNGYCGQNHVSGTGNGTVYMYYAYNGTAIGSITQAGTTGVLYNVTSDYRLKNVIGAVTGSGERIDALEPIEYQWKSDGSNTRGFLAHKFQEVYPQSVSGEKDAVDEEGNPKYQTMQASTSEVIADLIAEIQSLRKRLTALENK